MPVKVLNSAGHGSIPTIAAGVRWAADHAASVINLSIDESGLLAQIQEEGSLNGAVAYANAKGAVVVTAAGNDHHQNLQVYKRGVPAITVAAVDQSLQPAPFTNWGGTAEVAAPGVHIWSTAPWYPTTLFPLGTDGTGWLSGTSMATPFVSGIAALLRADGATAAATQAALLKTAEPVEGATVLGHGVVNAAAALTYAKAHPHPQVAADFAPAWFRWTRLTLLATVVVKYTWALIQMVRRRWAARPFPQVC
jgi:subtilisin family serine protease